MKMFIVTYNWFGASLKEEVPAENPRRAEELFLQRIHGNYDLDTLNKVSFHIISIDIEKD